MTDKTKTDAERLRPEWMSLTVSQVTVETADTKSYRLNLGHHKPFSFQPGQFIILRAELWNPKKNRPTGLNRAFSLSSSPLETEFIEFTAKRYQDGRLTPWLFDNVTPGQSLSVKGPSGHFIIQEGETDQLVLLAGGIGIAPYRSMIRYILERKLPIEIHLYYSARTPVDFAYKSEIDRMMETFPQFHCLYTVTREHAGWSGRVGRVDSHLLRVHFHSPKTLYYLCGPDAMIDDLTQSLQASDIPKERIRSEKW